MSKCPLLIATPNHWVVDCYGEKCAWFHSVCKQPQKAKTNADRIRAMTDEELTDELLEWYAVFSAVEWTKDMILDWLREEVKDEDGEE